MQGESDRRAAPLRAAALALAVLALSCPPAECQPKAASTSAPSRTAGETWPRFRGHGGLGVSAAGRAPTSWDAGTGEGILWKTKVPLWSVSSPVVWGGRVFLTGATAKRREVYCFDARSGRLLWTGAVADVPGSPREVPKADEETGHAAPTPVTDGKRIYAIFANGDVAAFDLAGRRVWARNLALPADPYGHASSLAMHEGLLFVQVDSASQANAEAKLLALRAADGRTAWEAKHPVLASWASPIVAETAEGPQIVTAADARIIAHHPGTGRVLWSVRCEGSLMAPSPIFAAGLVIAPIAGDQVYAIRPGGKGDVTETHVAWRSDDLVPDVPSPVAAGGLLFVPHSGGNLACLDAATGRKLWEHEFDAVFYASPTIIGDRLYLLSRRGDAFVLKVGRKCEQIGKASLGEPCDASPAYADGCLYIRGASHLYCIGRPPLKATSPAGRRPGPRPPAGGGTR